MLKSLRFMTVPAFLALASAAQAAGEAYVYEPACGFSAVKMTLPMEERTEIIDNGLNTVLDIFFHAGSATITADQMPGVERIAVILRANPRARVNIKGYASCEGSSDTNASLSERRAAAVQQMLISRYNIAPGRITSVGAGVGGIFEVPAWNRVSVCTIEN